MSLYIPTKPRTVQKAGPVGPGAGVLMSEFSLNTILGRKTPQEKMREWVKLGVQVPWINAAEGTISGNASTVDWHLENEDEETVDDDYTGPMAQDARALLERPQAALTLGEKYTRRQLWEITFRHLGLCGNAFWFKDARNSYGIPTSILYIHPWRMTPVDDDAGNLIGWLLDRDLNRGLVGTKIDVDEVIHFVLNVPDSGHFGIGLVESAMLTASISQALNQHMASVLSAGGRLSGFLMPKEGVMDDTPFAQLVADFRNIVEQPDAAKRLQVVRAPVEFISTTMSPSELHIADLLNSYRDQLLALWRTPLSQIGGSNPAGLNSGDTRKYDEAAMWQNAIHPRIVAFTEAVQMHLLDLYDEAGASLDLVIKEPEFDDDSPRYDLLQKSLNSPLRNSERRELIGLDPFGPEVLGESGQPLDDEVWMPITLALAFSAAENAQNAAPTPTETALGRGEGDGPVSDDNSAAGDAAGETAQGAGGATKAKLTDRQGSLHASLTKLRAQIDKTHTPKLKVSVAAVLEAQRTEIADRIRKHAAAIVKTPKDTTTWWDGAKWDKSLSRALAGRLRSTAETVNEHISGILPPTEPAKASVSAVDRVLAKGAARVTRINETTRDKIREALVRAVEQGMTANDAADAIEAGVAVGGLDMASLFDEYRSEMIARTELMDAYNATSIATYSDAGLTEVQAIDGDGDPECAERDGQTFSTDDADSIEDHPNGTLDWVPVIEEPAKAKVQPINPADLMTVAQAHAQQANAMLEHVSGMQLAQSAIDALSAHNDQHEADRAAMTHAILNQPPAIHHVEAPIIQVQAAEAPSVTVNAPPPDFSPMLEAISAQTEALRPRQVVKTVQRDAAQRITSVVETPIDPEPDNDPDDA